VVSREDGTEHPGSINSGGFSEELSDCQLHIRTLPIVHVCGIHLPWPEEVLQNL
jgi:hypothetical protein